jgi:uncharacterized protein YkvS
VLLIIGENILNRKDRKIMKKYEIGNIVKTKKGDNCVIVDIIDDDAIIFNITKMRPDTINIKEIKEVIGKANCTTMVIDGKEVRVKTDEETKENETKNETNEEDNKNETNESENDDIEEIFGEMVKIFGKAAIELGNIFIKIAEGNADDKE